VTTEEPAGEVDAAQAFEDLRGEVSVLRRTIEELSGQWESHRPPDYTVTLGAIAKGLATVAERLEVIEAHPALKLTAQQHQEAIALAGNGLMRGAAEKFYAATTAAERERQTLVGLIGSARTQAKQLKWLAWTGGIALLLGLLLSPFVVRLLPFGWDESVAASILNTDRWNAGIELMRSTNPSGWDKLVAEMNLVEPNHEALTACREAAARLKKPQSCAIVVPAP
jgi:hypothetical protein